MKIFLSSSFVMNLIHLFYLLVFLLLWLGRPGGSAQGRWGYRGEEGILDQRVGSKVAWGCGVVRVCGL